MLDPNQRLGEQLRKLLDEQNLAEARRVMELATEIKQSAVQLTANPPDNNTFLWVETDPAVDMPLERPLWTPPITTSYADIEPEVVLINLSAIDLKALFDQFYVDESRLHRHIAAPSRMMKNLPSFTNQLTVTSEQHPNHHRGWVGAGTVIQLAAVHHQLAR